MVFLARAKFGFFYVYLYLCVYVCVLRNPSRPKINSWAWKSFEKELFLIFRKFHSIRNNTYFTPSFGQHFDCLSERRPLLTLIKKLSHRRVNLPPRLDSRKDQELKTKNIQSVGGPTTENSQNLMVLVSKCSKTFTLIKL